MSESKGNEGDTEVEEDENVQNASLVYQSTMPDEDYVNFYLLMKNGIQ